MLTGAATSPLEGRARGRVSYSFPAHWAFRIRPCVSQITPLAARRGLGQVAPFWRPQISLIGPPVGDRRVVLNMAEIKSEINAGRMPDVLHILSINGVLDAEGGLWFIRSASAEIARYDAKGTLQWERSYADLPEADQILERFFERNAAIESPNGFAPLLYFRDAALVDERLWLLVALSENEPALILVVDQDGVIEHRLRVPDAAGAGSMAIGPDADRVYLGVHTRAGIMEAAIPPDIK